jgi:hypothetical protein
VDQPYSASPIPSESWSRARHRCPLDRRVRELGRSPALIGASELVHITSRFGRGPGPARQVNPTTAAYTSTSCGRPGSCSPDSGGVRVSARDDRGHHGAGAEQRPIGGQAQDRPVPSRASPTVQSSAVLRHWGAPGRSLVLPCALVAEEALARPGVTSGMRAVGRPQSRPQLPRPSYSCYTSNQASIIQ